MYIPTCWLDVGDIRMLDAMMVSAFVQGGALRTRRLKRRFSSPCRAARGRLTTSRMRRIAAVLLCSAIDDGRKHWQTKSFVPAPLCTFRSRHCVQLLHALGILALDFLFPWLKSQCLQAAVRV